MNKCKKFVSVFLVSVLVFAAALLVPEIESNAYGESPAMDFYVKYSEPTCNEYSGYFSVAYSSNGTYRMYTYFWTFLKHGTTEYATDEANFMYVQVDSNKVYFQPYCTSKGGVDVVLCCYDNNDDFHYITNQYIPEGTQTFGIYQDDYSASPVSGYCFGGNALLSTYSTLKDVVVPIIHWNESVDASQLDEQMAQIIGALNNIDYDTSYIISQLQNIYNQNVSTNQKLEDLKTLLSQLQQEANALQEKENQLQEESNNLQKEQNETSKGIFSSIKDFFGSFFQNLIDSIVSVFVPEDGYFTDYFDRLYDFFSEKLGFLIYPFELMADFINAYLSIGEGSGQIVISDVVMFDTVLIKATSFDLKGAMSGILGDYYDLYYAFVDCILLFGFVAYALKKFNSVVGGTGE